VFSSKYKVPFADTDAGGIVFFANYFKIAHFTYEKFFENLNFERNYFLDDEYIIPIVNSSADFKSPVKFGETVICRVYVEKVGNTSFTLKYDLLVDNEIVAEVKTSHVLVKKNDFVKAELTGELRIKLTEHLI
jgi:1,4-dihydroxy-2-naphthoyl-CoA hydrolase